MRLYFPHPLSVRSGHVESTGIEVFCELIKGNRCFTFLRMECFPSKIKRKIALGDPPKGILHGFNPLCIVGLLRSSSGSVRSFFIRGWCESRSPIFFFGVDP